MKGNRSSVKSFKAYLLTGVFLSIIAFDICTVNIPDFENDSYKTSLTKSPVALLVLRDASVKSSSYFPALKIFTLGYQIVQSVEVLREEPLLQPTLLVTQSFRNVFYVYISSSAP